MGFNSFGYFRIPTVNKDLNKQKKRGSFIRGTVRSGNCASWNCPSRIYPWGKCLWGTVRRGKFRPGNIRRGTVLEFWALNRSFAVLDICYTLSERNVFHLVL